MQIEKITGLAKYSLFLLCTLWASAGNALELPGHLNWVNRVQLSTAVPGVVDSVLVAPGDQVKQGGVLLKLEDKTFRLQLAGLSAQVNKLKVIYDEAQRELDRANELYDRTLLSDHELQVIKNNFASAEADLDFSKSKLAQAKVDFDYSHLKAPFDAIILSRFAEKGMVVRPDLKPQPLIEVASLGRMLAEAVLNADERQQLNPGQEAQVVIDGVSYKGIVRFISLEPIDTAKASYKLQVQFDTGSKLFPAGKQVKIKL
ncbi:MAG: efflux RND transporter periplasmic adaptor subunit [Gammaproteobacteria bacterium]|nr:efflux RND transporter periplasmic adaptor subunit [Gammaproteobacteria bacterium]